MAKILLVDDERTLVDTISYNLKREGYEVLTAYDGAAALETARREKPDLLVLDVMLPQLDGFEVCRILRKDMTVPILMLSAKEDETNRIVGLEVGADDYLTKPFSMRELLARIKALLRRIQMMREAALAAQKVAEAQPLVFGQLTINPRERSVKLAGRLISLKPKEFDLLAFLVANRGQVFTRDQLLQHVWGYDYVTDTRTVDVHISGLREKIEALPGEPRLIETIRGVGYRFVK